MKLAGYIGEPQHLDILRDLTPEEVARSEYFKPVVAEAEQRLKLFKMLQLNYKEWSDCLVGLLCAKRVSEQDDDMLNLDRLLLNYLTCAYTIREHFKVSFQQRFRKDVAEKNKAKDFIDRLCAKSWAFAFFMDFRNHVQHRGLGIDFYSRNVSRSSVTLTITQDAAKLLAENPENWKRSGLKGDEGKLDLITLLQDFHSQMFRSYAGFVVKVFYPELIPAAKFFGELTAEVKRQDKRRKMVFVHELRESKLNDKTTVNFSLKMVPNDVFEYLGISTVA